MAATPRDILLPYQREWVEDTSRFKIGLQARQTGKSMATAEEAVADAMARKTTWVIGSAGERQALEWMLKARDWLEAYGVAVADYEEIRDHGEALLKNAEATLANGSRIIALPANPSTMRGYSANLVLDEFAFHEDPDAIWRAIYPSISNPLKGEYKIRIVSTPNGTGNKFADLWHKAIRFTPTRPKLGKGQWSGHFVDIHTAVARGLPIDIEELRAGLDDPEGWAVEYECQFLDSAAVLLPYDVIAGIENPLAMVSQSPEFWLSSPRGQPPIDLGIDFGRKKDLTVCWSLEDLGGYQMTREVLEIAKTSTTTQAEILSLRCQRARRVCVDYTGPGVGLGDMLVDRFGQWDPDKHQFGKVELVTFSQGNKVEMFSKLRMKADSKRLGIPATKLIREDLHSMHRVVSPGGGISYRAAHTEDGHADRCTALALAVRAGDNPILPFAWRPASPRGGRSSLRRQGGVNV
jgi:phage FluMu gp28-like protein